ncbi:MAG: radical SAM protein [Nitrospirae bacterium]|nr:radical SAM protein [Nitrospirota bacterium]
MSKKLVIYLADLANTAFGCSPSTIPLAIGYIKAYAMEQLSDDVNIELFRTFESLNDAIKKKAPNILGFSWYGWNTCLTINAISHFKKYYPDILVVIGGANTSDNLVNCLRDFNDYPEIDVMIPNEGEIPFVNLLRTFLREGRTKLLINPIEGCIFLSDSKELIYGRPVIREKDINIYPSPYLNGFMDDFCRDSNLMPIIQTMRGCPYHCLFCVSAKDTWNKLRSFDLKRVNAEIEYISTHSENKNLRLTDENFGIMPRDIEIAKFIADKNKNSGYPTSLRLYTDKNINNRIKQITLMLKDLVPMNISVQTLTDSVAKNIHRRNIEINQFNDAVNWAHKNNIIVTTELIFGLPGETVKTFMDCLDKLIEMRLDSIAFGCLRMLKETEINTPEQIVQYGYKIKYYVGERGYTKTDNFESIETEEWAVEDNFFTYDEYIKILLFHLIFDMFIFYGYFKEVVYTWENRGIKTTAVIQELLENSMEYPFISKQVERLKECLTINLFNDKEELYKSYKQRLSSENSTASQYIGFIDPFILEKILHGEMLHISNQDTFIDEVVEAGNKIFSKYGIGNKDDYNEEIYFVKDLVKKIIIPFWEISKESILITSKYDLKKWVMEDYKGILTNYKMDNSVDFIFKINSVNQYIDYIKENSDKPLYLQSEFFFRTFRSNNIRRYLVLD